MIDNAKDRQRFSHPRVSQIAAFSAAQLGVQAPHRENHDHKNTNVIVHPTYAEKKQSSKQIYTNSVLGKFGIQQ